MFLLLLLAVAALPAAPPETHRGDTTERLHGIDVADPYRWLEIESPASQQWAQAQDGYTKQLLKAQQRVEQQVFEQLRTLNVVTYVSVPNRTGDRYFYWHNDGKQDFGILMARDGSLEAPARAVLNPNRWNGDGNDWWFPSPDGKLIAYGRSRTGTEMSTLYVRDVDKGVDLPLRIPDTDYCTLAWSADGSGFYYTRSVRPEGPESRYYKGLFYHVLGTDWRDDRCLVGPTLRKTDWVSIQATNDPRYHLIKISVMNTTRLSLLVPDGDGEELRLVPVARGTLGSICNGRLLLMTNDGALRNQVVSVSLEDPSEAEPEVVIPEQEGVIRSFSVTKDHIVVQLEKDLCGQLVAFRHNGKRDFELDLPGKGAVLNQAGYPDSAEICFEFSSFLQPHTVFRYDLKTRTKRPFVEVTVDRDLPQIVEEIAWARSKDGTRIPIRLLRHADAPKRRARPLLLNVYGGFGLTTPSVYSPGPLLWLSQGGNWAHVCARGGGEFGARWHMGGWKQNKQNTFDDVVAAAEALVEQGFAIDGKLAISGHSNGALTATAVITQRPDLFRAAVLGSGLYDMLRFHRFDVGAYWIREYGSPNDPEAFEWLHAYSPYHQVRRTDYPAMLFWVGDQDTRVSLAHSRKMVAALQAASTSDKPILYWREQGLGHDHNSMSSHLSLQARRYTFLLWQLDLLPFKASRERPLP